jgi:hypothetical protein
MEDVNPVEDENDRNLTAVISHMVNESLGDSSTTRSSDSSNHSVIISTNIPRTPGEDGPKEEEESDQDVFEDAKESDEEDKEKEENGSGSGLPEVKGPDKSCRPVKCKPVACTPVACEPVACKPVPCKPGKPVPCKPGKPVPCAPVPCKPEVDVFHPCDPVPCQPVNWDEDSAGSPPVICRPEATPGMSVPVAMVVGATASLVAVGLAATVGLILRYLPPLVSGFIFITTIIFIWYVCSHYPGVARDLGQRALNLAREATTTLVNRAMAALRGHNQVSFYLYCYSSLD